MKRILVLVFALVFLLVVLLALSLTSGGGAREIFQEATIVPHQGLTPVPTAPSGLRIAVLTLSVFSRADGVVERVELDKGRIIAGYGPNVLGLSGAWTVELVGERSNRFGTFDPRRIEVENKEGEPPFIYIFEPNTTWDLVVPLNDASGKDLQVQEIRLFDEDGNLVFAVAVRQGELIPIEVPPAQE